MRGALQVLAAMAMVAGCGRVRFDDISRDGAADDSGAADVAVDADPFMLTPSCMGLGPTCGADGTSPCCGSLIVDGGTFARSHDRATDAMYPDTTHPATLSTFFLDRYEVTVGRFRAFVDAGNGTQQAPPPTGAGARPLNGMPARGGWEAVWNSSLEGDKPAMLAALNCDLEATWTDTPGTNESLPMSCMTWFEAFAFCAWDGGFLATEAEWNYAAAGGNEQRAFPWSKPASDTTIDCTYANYNPGTFCVPGPGVDGFPNRPGSESPNGDGRWGHADLTGNVWEWTLDWYASPYADPCVDCANLTPGGSRTFRGGSYFNTLPQQRPAQRNSVPPTSRYANFGIRCARMGPG
jgi:formylglycine-generating enzyme required for sulfatase activity